MQFFKRYSLGFIVGIIVIIDVYIVVLAIIDVSIIEGFVFVGIDAFIVFDIDFIIVLCKVVGFAIVGIVIFICFGKLIFYFF